MGNESSSVGNIGIIQAGPSLRNTCHACRQIEILLTHYDEQPKLRNAEFRRRIIPFYSNYHQLDQSAKQCPSCRIFRQALLLNCGTAEEANRFADKSSQSPIYVTFVRRLDSSLLPEPRSRNETAEVQIPLLDDERYPVFVKPKKHGPDIILETAGLETHESIRVSCYHSQPTKLFALNPNPLASSVRQQIRRWIATCDIQHAGICSNLSWSSQNPSRLVQITEEGRLRLVDAPQGSSGEKLRYVALSYCWGTQTDNEDMEKKVVVEGSMTRLQNLKNRYERIGAVELPNTIADALRLIHGLGISYMWVDSLCIIQDSESDWQQESARMHEYYGNAYFTLCIMSNTKATEPLAQQRQAWVYGSSQCRLNGLWLDIGTDLQQARESSPLAKRAWALQEEQLSPRILYWTAQRYFWSCACHERGEELACEDGDAVSGGSTVDTKRPTDHAQAFLISLRAANKISDVHAKWLSLLESYTRRSLTQQTDIFPALAGLATRYGNANQDDRYIAGLWRSSFALGLAWSVSSASSDMHHHQHQHHQHTAPSWSWASLPPNTSTKMARSISEAPDFALLGDSHDSTDFGTDVAERVAHGASITHVRVRGRLRPLWTDKAVLVPWSGVCPLDDDVFSFSFMPQQDMYAADMKTARLVAYEARREEVLVQLDYALVAAEAAASSSRSRLWALEIGADAMLVLERDEERGCYRRVGIRIGYRHNFFDRSEVREIRME